VNAAGPAAADIASLAGAPLPSTAGELGLTVLTDPRPRAPERVLRWPGFHARPASGGRIVIGANAFDDRIPAQRDGEQDRVLAREALADAAAFLPDLLDATVESARVARRSVPSDGLPVVGRDARAPWLYHLVSHSGVTLAALLSRLATAELLESREEAQLAPYRAARFPG
jgi:glycine/D-amino acid oxidase-like deaminating enzyme